MMNEISLQNTLTYRRIFHCYPDDDESLKEEPFYKYANGKYYNEL